MEGTIFDRKSSLPTVTAKLIQNATKGQQNQEVAAARGAAPPCFVDAAFSW